MAQWGLMRPIESEESDGVRLSGPVFWRTASPMHNDSIFVFHLSSVRPLIPSSIALNRLKSTFRISGTALKWINSYLTNHSHYSELDNSPSDHHSVHSLRSSDQHFPVPYPSSTNFGFRSFHFAALIIWLHYDTKSAHFQLVTPSNAT